MYHFSITHMYLGVLLLNVEEWGKTFPENVGPKLRFEKGSLFYCLTTHKKQWVILELNKRATTSPERYLRYICGIIQGYYVYGKTFQAIVNVNWIFLKKFIWALFLGGPYYVMKNQLPITIMFDVCKRSFLPK